MAKKDEAPERITPGPQAGSDTITNNLWNYNTTKDLVLQAAKYPPGWLIARTRQAPPENAASRAAVKYLLDLIWRIGRPVYQDYKKALGIPLDTPHHRLTRQQCWQLTHAITQDLEAAK